MARIRTVKPAFFRHRRLYLAEQESGLPLRVAFAGLWTCADRAGRFKWEPEELKLDCLPFDDVDFSRVLDALVTRGFLVKYAWRGKFYGCIPSFLEHQVINNKESPSILPEPPEPTDNIEEVTRDERVPDATTTREVKEKGEGKGKDSLPSEDADASLKDQIFGKLLNVLAKRLGKTTNQCRPLVAKWLHAHGDGPVVEAITAMSRNSAVEPVSYIESLLAKRVVKNDGKRTDTEWENALARFTKDETWPAVGYGPQPGYGGCLVPHKLLVKHGLIDRNISMAG